MQILMLLEKDFPPDLRVEKEIKALVEDDNKITLVCYTHKRKDEIEHAPNITIYRYAISTFVHKSSVAALKFPFYFNFWINNLNTVFQNNSFVFIHVHDLPLAKVAKKFAVKFHIPMILDLHENWPALLKVSYHANTLLGKILSSVKQWRAYELSALKWADKLIVVVDEAKERIIKMGIPESKIEIVSNTINACEITFNNAEKVFPHSLVYAGGLNYYRGLQIVLPAISKLIEKYPDLKLWIIGSGKFRKRLDKMIISLHLEKHVQFTGWLSFENMLKFLMQAQIALVPHLRSEHTDSTIPHKLFQYFAANKPVISSDCLPLKRIISQTGAGLVYKFNDPTELAHQITCLFEDENLCDSIRENQKKALEKYNWQRDSLNLKKLYKNLVQDFPKEKI